MTDYEGGGLDSREACSRLEKYGYNEVPVKRPNPIARAAKPFLNPLSYMLEAIALLSWLTGNIPEALIMVGLLIFNAALLLVREGTARKDMLALRQRLRLQSRVRRDGVWASIPSRELVPGDLIRVRPGDIVAADAKLVDGTLDVDQSALTGESVAATKASGEVIFSGSVANRGEATANVVATGSGTHFGRTVELVSLAKPKLHMEQTVKSVTMNLARISIVAIVITSVYAYLKGIPIGVLLPIVVVLLVAALPVVMPTMFTLNMALGASALAKEGVLVTRLGACEDAAAMDVLCVDKTGTLTQNKLYVEKEIPAKGYDSDDVVLFGALASNESDQDPIDQAILAASSKAGIRLDTYRRSEFMPFNSQSRMTGATVRGPSGEFYVRKGSSQAISSILGQNDGEASALDRESQVLASEGLKAVAVAQGSPKNGFQLVGLFGVADRIRDDSKEVVESLNGLGVSTKMLTGDELPIARSVARQVGLTGEVTKAVPSETSTPVSVIEGAAGLAEIYPEDKYSVVKSLQDAGHVVGMTGDGVNDSPALRQAEVGIAVKGAMDIAKDSASAVLIAEGLKGTISLVKTARTTYERLQNWVTNLITKKTLIIAYVVATLLVTGYFAISVFGVVLVLFLGDFATMSASSDNVRYSEKPSSFNIPWLFRLGASLGLAATLEGVALTLAGISYLGLAGDPNKIYAFSFAYLVLAGIFNLLIVRERHHFWESRPGNLLTLTAIAEVLVVSLIAIFGFIDLAPIGIAPFGILLAFTAAATFGVNDLLKVSLLRRFGNFTPPGGVV